MPATSVTPRSRSGFGLAGVGMVAGLVQYVLGGKHLGDAGLHAIKPDDPAKAEAETRRLRWALGIVALLTVVAVGLWAAGIVHFTIRGLADSFGVVLLTLTLAFFAWLLSRPDWTPAERKRIIAVIVLFFAAAFFWAAYEQAGSSLNLFARDFTDRAVAGFEFPASWFQWVPALFVILQAPIFAWLWVKLGARQPSSPAKFSLGLFFVGLGFVVMMLASRSGAIVGPVRGAVCGRPSQSGTVRAWVGNHPGLLDSFRSTSVRSLVMSVPYRSTAGKKVAARSVLRVGMLRYRLEKKLQLFVVMLFELVRVDQEDGQIIHRIPYLRKEGERHRS